MNSALLEKFQLNNANRISRRFRHLSTGWREIGGKRIYFKSRWEANYARYLQWLFETGEIKEWNYEAEVFWFEKIRQGVRSYKPDFKIINKKGETVYIEVKGFMDRKSKTKIKRMRIYHPHIKLLVAGQSWFAKNGRKISKLVPGWEHESMRL